MSTIRVKHEKYYSSTEYDQDYCKKTLLEMIQSSPFFDLKSKSLRYFRTVISNKEFIQNINSASVAFRNMGIKENGLVFMFMLNTPEFGYSFYALNNIGAVCEWFNPSGVTPELLRNRVQKRLKNKLITNPSNKM